MLHPSHHAILTPEKIAYRMADTGDTLTFAELEARSNRGAHALRSLGINPGDHIAFLLENRLELIELIWAAQRCGVIFTAISRYLTHDEAIYIVEDCGAKLFITSDNYSAVGEKITKRLGGQCLCHMIGAPAEGFCSWDALVSTQPISPVANQCPGASMLYSSGTTGPPKGIIRNYPQGSLASLSPVLLKVCQNLASMDDEAVYLSPAPLYHSAPMAAAMVAAAIGATTIIMSRFDEERLLELIESYRVTHLQLVPTMFVRLVKLPKDTRLKYDITSLVAALHVAAPCPVEIKRQMIEWWGPVLVEYYAGTEGNGVTACTSDEWLANPGTVGRSLFGSVHILDDAGNQLPAGKIGDVYFNAGFTFSYHNDPEKTARAFTKQGWSTLGDIGWINQDGYLFLTDRRAYTIISGGVNIYPQETEDLLVTHSKIADVAVFGTPNEDLGEEVKAVAQLIEFTDAGPQLERELIAFCRRHLSALKTPKSVDFREKLPRTPTGKLMKRLLKDEYWA